MLTHKTPFVRILSFLLTLAVMICCAVSVHAEDSIDDLTSQKENLAVKQEELASQRDDAAESLEEQQAQSALIHEQIRAKSEEISLSEQILSELDEKIRSSSALIASKEAEIHALDQEIEMRRETLRSRLRAISKKSVWLSFLQFLFGKNSYSDFLIGFKVTERVSQNDQQLMDELEADIAALETAKSKIKTDKSALEIERSQAESVRNDMTKDKEALQQLYNDSHALEQEMAKDVDWLNEQIARMEEEEQSIQNAISSILEQIRAEEEAARKEAEENGEEYIPDYDLSFKGEGTMTWPAPTCRVITSSYKLRQLENEDEADWHYGLDIACYGDAEGEPVVAAADGVVWLANNYDSWGGGLGYFVMIDHGYNSDGRRVITTYAHCSRVDVYEGQAVDASEQIALIGDTGNSFGAHLHFQIDIDDEAVDPISNGYLSTDGIDVLG